MHLAITRHASSVRRPRARNKPVADKFERTCCGVQQNARVLIVNLGECMLGFVRAVRAKDNTCAHHLAAAQRAAADVEACSDASGSVLRGAACDA